MSASLLRHNAKRCAWTNLYVFYLAIVVLLYTAKGQNGDMREDIRKFEGDTTNVPLPAENAPFLFEFPAITPETYLPVVDAMKGIDWTFKSVGASSCIAKVCIHPFASLSKRTVVSKPATASTPVETSDVAPELATWDRYCSLLVDIPELPPSDNGHNFKLYPPPGPSHISVGIARESTGCKFELSYSAELICEEGKYGYNCQETITGLDQTDIVLPPNESRLFLLAPEGNSIVGGTLRIRASGQFSVYTFENTAPSMNVPNGYDFANTTNPDQTEMNLSFPAIRFYDSSTDTAHTPTQYSSPKSQKGFFGIFIRVHNPSADSEITLQQMTAQFSRCQVHSTGDYCSLNIGLISPVKFERNPNFACCDDGVKFGIYYGMFSPKQIANAEAASLQNMFNGSATLRADDKTWSFGLALASKSLAPSDFPAVYLRRGNIPLLHDDIAPFKRSLRNPFLWTTPGNTRKGYDLRIDTPSELSRFIRQKLLPADESSDNGIAWYYMVVVNPQKQSEPFSFDAINSSAFTSFLSSSTKMKMEEEAPEEHETAANGLKMVAWGGSTCPSSCSKHGTCGTNDDPHRCVCHDGFKAFPDCSTEPVPPPPYTPPLPTPIYLQFWFIMVCVVIALMAGLLISLLYMRHKKKERFFAFFDASTVDYLAIESKADVKKGYLFSDDLDKSGHNLSGNPQPIDLGSQLPPISTDNVVKVENAPLLSSKSSSQTHQRKESTTYGGLDISSKRSSQLHASPSSSSSASMDTKFARPIHHRAGSSVPMPSKGTGKTKTKSNNQELLGEAELNENLARGQLGSGALSSQFDTYEAKANGVKEVDQIEETSTKPATPNGGDFGDLIRIGIVGGERIVDNVARFEEDSSASDGTLGTGQKWATGTL